MIENKQNLSSFNTRYEVSLRLLLLLSEATIWPLSSLEIADIDFMTIYGKEFGVSDINLNGDNKFKFGQLKDRKKLIEESLKKLVRLGWVYVNTKNGFKYMINDHGTEYISKMDDTYSRQYRQTVKSIFKKYDVRNLSVIKEAEKKSGENK